VTTVYARLALAAGVAGTAGWIAGRLTVALLRAVGVAPDTGTIGDIGKVSAGLALLVSAVFVLVLYGLVLKLTGVAELEYVLRPLAGALRRTGLTRSRPVAPEAGDEPEPTSVHPDGRAPGE
jgi:hypothetical protein